MSVSWEALAEDIRRAQPGSHLFYELIREAKRRARQGDTMGTKYDSEGFSMILGDGSVMHGGSGRVRGNAGIGRKGKGKGLTPAEAKKLMRQQVAKERKLAAQTAKKNAAAKRAARAQQKARRG